MSSSKFPGFDKLHSIGSKGSTREFIADIDFGSLDYLSVLRGDAEAREVSARWTMGGSEPGQVVWTTLVGPVLLSEEVVASLREAGLSGWATYPVALTGKEGESLGTYFGLVVKGRCGPIDMGRCRREEKEYPAGAFPVLKGLYFEEESWDGSDFFMPSDGTAWVFVTGAAKKALGRRARNVRFEVLDDVEQMPAS